MNYRDALVMLCDEVIRFASPHRGEPPSDIHERRDKRPTHIPDFIDLVIVARVKALASGQDQQLGLLVQRFKDSECELWLERVLHLIFEEASGRTKQSSPAAMHAYFDTAVEISWLAKPKFAWYWLQKTSEITWTGVLASKLRLLENILIRDSSMAHTT